jgi:hypothetical protein
MKREMAAAALLVAGAAAAETVGFDNQSLGEPPTGWTCGVTGSGRPHWTVERHDGAPSPPNVLLQSGQGTFPWCVREDVKWVDGFVEVKFKPIRGREDQAGGVVWRWKNGDRYYVARANALENNVSLYYAEGGVRKTLKYVDAPVAKDVWHTLRVDYVADGITVTLDGKVAITYRDRHIEGPGSIGVWTKADSVTAFDDFSYGPATAR